MKEKIRPLKIFNFSSPLMMTEVLSLAGDKYSQTLPFPWEFSADYASSDIILWDGIITVKIAPLIEKMIEDIKKGKVLLLIGETMTLLKDHPMVKIQSVENLNVVEVPGWNVLPEEILMAIEACHKKTNHV